MGVPHREEIEVLFARSTEALEAMLETAFKERNLADYEAFAKFSAEQVTKRLSEAEAFVSVVKAFVERKGFLAS